jgi:hypothetical protein
VEFWEEAEVNSALREQLGLELQRSREKVEVLVVKSKESSPLSTNSRMSERMEVIESTLSLGGLN